MRTIGAFNIGAFNRGNAMGLAVAVGLLADLLENDPEFVDELRADLGRIDEVLRENGLPGFAEPEKLPPVQSRAPVESFPYSFLHYLRRAYAHHVLHPDVPLPESEDPSEDPIVDEVGDTHHHLLWHSDCEGFYVPVDFAEVIEDEAVPGGGFGSSQRLSHELVAVAPLLGIRLDGTQLGDVEIERLGDVIDVEGPLWIEILVWLALFEAARISVAHGTAVVFC
jgi:hypothetical protein